ADAAAAAKITTILRLHHHDDVVHHRAVARASFGGLYPLVLGPAWIDGKELIFDRALFRNRIRLVSHVDDLIGLADLPALDKLARLGQIGRIALRAAVFDPAR